jgi:hypothetical protein
MGSHLWVSDHVNGFCRLDKNAATGKFTINAATCLARSAHLRCGQQRVYVPDNSTKGNAVYRLKFNPLTETVSTSAALGSSALVAGAKPPRRRWAPTAACTWARPRGARPCGSPTPPPTGSPVQTVGSTTDGRGASGLAFANATDGSLTPSLYIAERGGISEIANATPAPAAASRA